MKTWPPRKKAGMPRGVYERRPCMKTFGRTAAFKDRLLADRANGKSKAEAARMYGVSTATVYHLERGAWNEGRRRTNTV